MIRSGQSKKALIHQAREDPILKTSSIPLPAVPGRLGISSTGLGSTPTQPWATIFRRAAESEPNRRSGDRLFDSIRHRPLLDEPVGGSDAAESTGCQQSLD